MPERRSPSPSSDGNHVSSAIRSDGNAIRRAHPRRSTRAAHRAILAALLFLCAATIILSSPLRQWLHDTANGGNALAHLGGWRYPVTGAVAALLMLAGVPRLALCGLAAMAFGFLPGLIITQIASLLGYYAMFLFVRWGGREWVMARWPQLDRWSQAVGRQGTAGVILARQLPLHGAVINLGLGLSTVGHIPFLVGTLLGLIPEAVPAALIGAGIVQPEAAGMWVYLAVAVIALVLIWTAAAFLVRKLRRCVEPPPQEEVARGA